MPDLSNLARSQITPEDFATYLRVDLAIAQRAAALCRKGCPDPDCHRPCRMDDDWRRDAYREIAAEARAYLIGETKDA